MTSYLTKLDWRIYAAIGATLFVVLTVIVFFVSGGSKQSAFAKLPPVQTADIPAGFVGEQSFGAWKLVCQNLDAATQANAQAPKRLCRANARMMAKMKGENQKPFLAAGFNILMVDNQPNPAIMFRLPLGARAASTIGFAIDENTFFSAPLRCSDKECTAQGALPTEALAQMRDGQTLKLIYTIKDAAKKDRKVRVDQILYGFPQAYEAMTSAMAS